MRLLKAIAGGAVLQLAGYLNQAEQKKLMASCPELEDAILSTDEAGLQLLEQQSLDPDAPYARLIRFLSAGQPDLQAPAQTLLDFSVAAFLYPQLLPALKKITGHAVTTELAFLMEGREDATYQQQRQLYEQAAALLNPGKEAVPFFHISMCADNRILGFLSGSPAPDQRLRNIADYFDPAEPLPPLLVDEPFCNHLEAALRCSGEVMIIRGSEGRGKWFVLTHALQRLGRGMIRIHMPALLRRENQRAQLLRLALREAMLHRCGVCFHGITRDLLHAARLSLAPLTDQLMEACGRYELPVVFCCDEMTDLLPRLSVPASQFDCKPLTRQERIQLWQGYGREEKLDLDFVQLGSKYRFTPAEIQKACLQLHTQQEKGPLDQRRVAQLLNSIVPPILTKGKIEPYHPDCTLDSLVLPPEAKQTILDICNTVWSSHKVYDDWNLESKFAYGKAISVLLSGPPGTGKTMTARVLSDLLQLPLYHVNLSQLVDKYIGETEKHLEEIFSNTERSNMILFFDEADSIFGKRSEVNDAKDKYANTEVSYILQRIESFDGIVILATNYIRNVDPAFMRRMKYVLRFQLPDREERLALWQNSFPPECPLGQLNFDLLADQFEFSGSGIKNVVLTAAFLAARENVPVQMRHIMSGIKNEYCKMDQPIFPSILGNY